jgi:hypothetical protein
LPVGAAGEEAGSGGADTSLRIKIEPGVITQETSALPANKGSGPTAAAAAAAAVASVPE